MTDKELKEALLRLYDAVPVKLRHDVRTMFIHFDNGRYLSLGACLSSLRWYLSEISGSHSLKADRKVNSIIDEILESR